MTREESIKIADELSGCVDGIYKEALQFLVDEETKEKHVETSWLAKRTSLEKYATYQVPNYLPKDLQHRYRKIEITVREIDNGRK